MAWVDIYDRNSTYGYGQKAWQEAKERARNRIVANLRKPVLLTIYGDLLEELRAVIDFDTPRNPIFHCLLGQISDDAEDEGFGLLTALVVHKSDRRPGSGFYTGAAAHGRDIGDEEKCWNEEIRRLQAASL